MLTNNPIVWNFNQGDIFQIMSPHSDGKIWYKYSHQDFPGVWNRVTCWLSKDILRGHWRVSDVTKPLRVANIGNALAMTIFFFSKMFKIWWRFHQWNEKSGKCFFFLRQLDLNRERQILTIRNTILVIGNPCVNKQPFDFKLQSGRSFPNHVSSQWWKNMVKVLSWRFY